MGRTFFVFRMGGLPDTGTPLAQNKKKKKYNSSYYNNNNNSSINRFIISGLYAYDVRVCARVSRGEGRFTGKGNTVVAP